MPRVHLEYLFTFSLDRTVLTSRVFFEVFAELFATFILHSTLPLLKSTFLLVVNEQTLELIVQDVWNCPQHLQKSGIFLGFLYILGFRCILGYQWILLLVEFLNINVLDCYTFFFIRELHLWLFEIDVEENSVDELDPEFSLVEWASDQVLGLQFDYSVPFPATAGLLLAFILFLLSVFKLEISEFFELRQQIIVPYRFGFIKVLFFLEVS